LARGCAVPVSGITGSMTTVRAAVSENAEGLARVFLDSADHARLDPGSRPATRGTRR